MGKTTYDSIADALKTIATKLSATLPQRKYSTKKDEIADTLDAISDTDLGGGGGGSSTLIVEVTVNGLNETFNKTAGEIYEALEAGTPVLIKWPQIEQEGLRYSQLTASKIYIASVSGEIESVGFDVHKGGSSGFVGYYADSMNDYPNAYFGD